MQHKVLNEECARAKLLDLLNAQNQKTILDQVKGYFDLSQHLESQFEYFNDHLTEFHKSKLLISGCSAGSELLIAKKFGFSEIHGVEISQDLASIAKLRLSDEPSMHIDLYDGEHLPFEDASFSMITSSHVIEHTKCPFHYVAEHLRVLKVGGMFFIEFPSRYWYMELHTGLISFEYLPLKIRNKILNKLAKRILGYQVVINELVPISARQIIRYCKSSGFETKIIKKDPLRHGFGRLVVQKLSDK
jgi:SAM-dependent methyltransferase